MPALLDTIDPDGLLEFSVVFTDRSLNHMSKAFQGVMNDISSTLKGVYNAAAVAVSVCAGRSASSNRSRSSFRAPLARTSRMA